MLNLDNVSHDTHILQYCITLISNPRTNFPFCSVDFVYTRSLKFQLWNTRYYNNAYYAKVGGISTKEMNFLEVDFLFGLGFHLNVTPTTFHTYCSYLQREMMLQPQLNIDQESFTLNHHLCYNEDESSHQQQQQQLAV